MSGLSTFASLRDRILANPTKPSQLFWRNIERSATSLMALALSDDDKNRLWSIGNFSRATREYLTAFQQMSRGDFYEGWRLLEQAENAFRWSQQNAFVPELDVLIEKRSQLIELWQSLFPYRHFFSPGMRLKDWACSICGRKSTPVTPCGHQPGRVYGGQFCSRQITDFEALEISIVTDPVQKYSVLFSEDLEYDYSVVQYVLDRLSGPFHRWSGEWTTMRHGHDNFQDRAPSDSCPCDSGLHYDECCLLTNGVQLPHFAMSYAGPATYHEEVKLVKPKPRSTV